MKRIFTIPLLVAFSFIPLQPAEATSIEIGDGLTLQLPERWRIRQAGRLPDPQRRPSHKVNVENAHFLFTAIPGDQNRSASFVIFNTAYPLPTSENDALNLDIEHDRFLNALLAKGFTPKSMSSSDRQFGKRDGYIEIEATAVDTSGDEHWITCVTWPYSNSTFRYYFFHPKGDPERANEVEAVLKSLHTLNGWRRSASGPSRSDSSSDNNRSSIPSPGIGGDEQTSLKVAKFTQEYSPALLLIEGSKGVGSGFLYQNKGQTYAATNAHVVEGNAGFKITSLTKATIPAGPASIASGADMVRLEAPTGQKALEIVENLEQTVQIGDRVAVLGNADGAGVVTAVEGEIIGIGPDRIEVSAPFVKGNSGSPIIHVPTGKVIGIATYLTKRDYDADGVRTRSQIRRFGYRVDSIKEWEPVNWQRFFIQSAQVGKIEDLSQQFIKLFNNAQSGNNLDPAGYENILIQRAIQSLAPASSGRRGQVTTSAADRKTMTLRFLNELRSAARSDVASFDSKNSYDYFKRKVEEQRQFRETIYNDLTRVIEARR